MTVEDHMKLLEWLANGDTGMSSEYLAYTLAGVETDGHPCIPHDADDFGRCWDLLELMGWHDRFKAVMSDDRHGPYWNALLPIWGELTWLYRETGGQTISKVIIQMIDDVNRQRKPD